jgi:bifunctional DNA-binding transcriptional regulator/antitoxin component of YhaV-PrlF toxin-antitoxin module
MTHHARVIAGGEIAIPAELRRELGIKDGDSPVVVRGDAGGPTLGTVEQVAAERQPQFRALVGEDRSVDQFLRERRNGRGEQ